jgi:hypothetical protein
VRVSKVLTNNLGLVGLAFLCVLAGCAQDEIYDVPRTESQYRMKGIVRDAVSSEFITGVSVVVDWPGCACPTSTTTKADGTFRWVGFDPEPRGEFVEFRKSGYRTARFNVRDFARREGLLRFRLEVELIPTEPVPRQGAPAARGLTLDAS